MLENKLTSVGGIHYTRYIESWRNVGGLIGYDGYFDEWLKSEGLTDEEIHDIHEIYGMGKLELELSAKPFVDKQRKGELEWIEKELEKMENAKKKKPKLIGFFRKR